MALTNSQQHSTTRRSLIVSLANTFEWLIIAFILAFVFRAFVMEAFRIPTGSMADTLKGAHFRLACRQCGYRYDFNFADRSARYDRTGSPRCPSCGFLQPLVTGTPVANGDRILVLKCIYQFRDPERWDVVVFKNPGEPRTNFIKRLVGRPQETVEIIDGDVHINGQIARKPPKVQQELWMPIYDNDYQPVQPEQRGFKARRWQQPFRNISGSKWDFNAAGPTVFALNCSAGDNNVMFYDTAIGNNFRATYAYDDKLINENLPFCSDLMVRFYVNSAEAKGSIGIGLSKYNTHYQATVDLTGSMYITKADNSNGFSKRASEHSASSEALKLAEKKIKLPVHNKPVLVTFANVDHQLIFQFGDEELTFDLGTAPLDAGPIRKDLEPEVMIFGSGTLALSHVAIFRDIYYTIRGATGKAVANAGEGNPFTLHEDEFFVFGDNSPASFDSRFWSNDGIGNNGISYRQGIVPRDYLVGKAVFVYWPSGFRPAASFPFAIIPNIGQIRFIYGGSDETP